MRRRQQISLEEERQFQASVLRLLNPLARRVRIGRKSEVAHVTPRDVA